MLDYKAERAGGQVVSVSFTQHVKVEGSQKSFIK
jgi:hypothetical protein